MDNNTLPPSLARQLERAMKNPEYRHLCARSKAIEKKIRAANNSAHFCLPLMRRLLPIRRRMAEIFNQVNPR